MQFLRRAGQAINFRYVIRTEDRDGPDRPIRVVVVPGEALDFAGPDADRIRARLVVLVPDPPTEPPDPVTIDPPPADGTGKNITDDVAIRRKRRGGPGRSGRDAESRDV